MRPLSTPLLVLALLAGCAASGAREGDERGAEERPEAVTAPKGAESSAVPAETSGPRSRYFPNYRLTTHGGETIRFYDDVVNGRLVIVNFLYTRCTGI